MRNIHSKEYLQFSAYLFRYECILSRIDVFTFLVFTVNAFVFITSFFIFTYKVTKVYNYLTLNLHLNCVVGRGN
ncbi:hypothetical protein LCGC14_0959740 [marine sediment metagenome]|uniref:Uncharacterized protein n=1 Tax=marine sediment metagenome TaxID=412755 RepID=A0A0F9QY44_9ZZZZ